MRIFYDKSSDTHTLNFNYKNLSSSSNNEKDLLQILYSNDVELKAFGNISAEKNIIANGTITTKSGFYINDDSQNIISLYKDDNTPGVVKSIIKTDGLIIQDNLTNKELKIQSYGSNIELYTKKIDNNNNNSEYYSHIKIKDINNKDNTIDYTTTSGLIILDNYNYTDLTDLNNNQKIPTIYLQNSQIQMNRIEENESINETVFSVDKNGKVKCTEIDLPGESSNIIVNSIIFKNKISDNEINLFKITTQTTENKPLIIYDIPDSDTPIKKVLQLEKTDPNLFETYTLKSYGFETFGTTDLTTNSISNLKIDNDGTIICKNIEEYIFIYDNPSSNQNGIYHYENNQYIQDNDKNNYSIITSQNNEFNNNKGKLFIYNNTTWTNQNCTFSDEIPSSAPSSEEPNYWFNYDTKTFYKYDTNWSQITENIIICNRYDNIPNIPQEKILNLQNNQIEMKLNNNTIFKVDSNGSIITKSNINIENNGKFIMKNGNNPFLQVNYENNFENIETTKNINLYNGLSDNKFNEANKTISLSASGQITANEIIINNNGTSLLNDELNEDTQPKKYTKINNEFIQLYEEQTEQDKYYNYGEYVFINNDTKQLYKYDNNQYQQNNSYTYCICINHYNTYIYNSNEWDITTDIQFQRPNPANNGNLWFDKNENKLYVYNNSWGEYPISSYIVCNEFSSLYELKQRINININSDGIIDSKSINVKDDINDNKIYIGKYINHTDDDTNKLIRIMYNENNKSYIEMYSDIGSDRKQKLLIDNQDIITNNNIQMNDDNNKLWLSIKKGNGITIQKTDTTNTTYKNIINYGSLKISTKTGTEEEKEQIILTATGDIEAKGTITAETISTNNIHSTNYLTVDNNIYITKISSNNDEYIKFEVIRLGQQSLYAFLKLSTSDTPPSS